MTASDAATLRHCRSTSSRSKPATVDACIAAFDATGDAAWQAAARNAYLWFLGKNELGLALGQIHSGECHDGLMPTGAITNRGAELSQSSPSIPPPSPSSATGGLRAECPPVAGAAAGGPIARRGSPLSTWNGMPPRRRTGSNSWSIMSGQWTCAPHVPSLPWCSTISNPGTGRPTRYSCSVMTKSKRSSVSTAVRIREEEKLLIGAYFCHEYSFAAAALMNPSVTIHPDQSELAEGCVRIVLSLRAVGEGHISSIVFREGVVTSSSAQVRADTATPLYSHRSRQRHQPDRQSQ